MLVDRLRTVFTDRYRVERVLGTGGAAIVVLAVDERHQRSVAIKVLRPDVATLLGPDRFNREIRIAATLVHPHVLPLHDSGEIDGLLYYVMPYVDGETLQAHLLARGKLGVEESIGIARDVADALAYAHSRGVIHRDVKPGNIFLTQSGHALVGDFGIATAMADSTEQLTSTGTAMGTAAYMSPEQIDGLGVDHRTDVYALGCVLFEMLTGEPPFGRSPTRRVISGHVTVPPPDLPEARVDVSPSLRALVASALVKDAATRLPSAADFVERLGAESSSGTLTRVPRPPPRALSARVGAYLHRHLREAAIVAAVILAVGGFASIQLIGGSSDIDPSFSVIPLRGLGWTDVERDLAWDLADEITRQLNHWEGVRAVPQVALAGPVFDLGLEGDTPRTVDEGVRIARTLGVQSLVVLDVRARGDSLIAEAVVVNMSDPDLALGEPILVGGIASDLFSVAGPITLDLMGLTEEGGELGRLARLSTDATAIRLFHEGRRDLQRWRLAEARRSLETALTRDPTFSLAHHYLALTMYWQGASASLDLAELGPEVLRHVTAASRDLDRLTPREQRHIGAFRAFVQRDFDSARSVYGALIEEDPTDSYAHLLLGSVEYKDDELRADGLGPRANWNRAIRAFSESVRLSPDFSLGYGDLFALFGQLSESVACPVFWPPGERELLLWEAPTVAGVTPFCPVIGDSIAWGPVDLVPRPDVGDGEGLRRIQRATETQMERWAAYSPNEPRPQEELTRWTLQLRERLPIGATRAESDSLGAKALAHAERALSLRADTTMADRVRLSGLLLASGDLEGALRLADEVLASTAPSTRVPGAIIHPLMASGMPSRVIDILAPRRIGSALAAELPDGGFVRLGRGEPLVMRLEVLGATGASSPVVTRLIGELLDVWSAPDLREEERSVLKATTLRFIGPALVSAPETLPAWFERLDPAHIRDSRSEDMWRAWRTLADDPAAAREAFETSLGRIRSERTNVHTLFLHARLAQELGLHLIAIELFDRIERYPLSVGGSSSGWGLQTLSLMYQSRSKQLADDLNGAAQDLATLRIRWANAEPAVKALISL